MKRGRESDNISLEQARIKESTDNVVMLMEALAQRLKANKEGVGEDVLEQWKEKLQQLSKEALSLQHADFLFETTAKAFVEEKLSASEGHDNSSSSSSSSGLQEIDMVAIKKEITKRVDDQLSNFQVESLPQFQEIAALCNKQSKEDEDIFVDESEEITDQRTKCSVTLLVMRDPYKNTNPSAPCIHHLSKDGVDVLLKKNISASCPTPGCRGKWTRQHSMPDNAFKQRVERFLRMKNDRSQTNKFQDEDDEVF